MNAPAPRPFDALRLPGFAVFLVTFLLTMMADNVEHVMSYWIAFQKFHSPALGGFAVVSRSQCAEVTPSSFPLLYSGAYKLGDLP